MSFSSPTVAFLGAGRMAQALIRGFLDAKLIAPHEIIASSKSGSSAVALSKKYSIQAAANNKEAIDAASVIFLCTKPAQAVATLLESASALKNKLIISVVAGISSQHLFEAAGGHSRVIRTMPNTAVRLRKGATTIAVHASATPEDLALAQKLFSSVGTVYEIAEKQKDAATAVSGSGPAFALLFLEALMEGGIEAGLEPTLARALAAHAIAAAGALVLETNDSPAELRTEITSPQGTTEAGLRVLEDENLISIVKRAIHAAKERSKQLALLLLLMFFACLTTHAQETVITKLNPEPAKKFAVQASREYSQGQLTAAESSYQKALNLAPKNIDYLNHLAAIETRLSKPQEAEGLLKQSLQEQLENPAAWLLLGMNYLEEQQVDKAFAALVQATLYDPKNARAQHYLGIAAGRKHWNEISEGALRKAIELDPNYADAHFNLAVYYLRLTPPPLELARRHYQRALDLGAPHDPKMDAIMNQATEKNSSM